MCLQCSRAVPRQDVISPPTTTHVWQMCTCTGSTIHSDEPGLLTIQAACSIVQLSGAPPHRQPPQCPRRYFWTLQLPLESRWACQSKGKRSSFQSSRGQLRHRTLTRSCCLSRSLALGTLGQCNPTRCNATDSTAWDGSWSKHVKAHAAICFRIQGKLQAPAYL